MRYVRLPVTLTLVGPILTGSSTPGSLGIDNPIARNSRDEVILPFSLVKGRVRQSWDELSQKDIEIWFGGSGDAGGGIPLRGRFRFSDFVAFAGDRTGVRHRIRIDRATGAADDGALQFIESPFASGETVEFRGEVRWFQDGAEDDSARLLENAFRWTTGFGAERTAGFGRMADVQLGTPVQTTVSENTQASVDAPIKLGLTIDMLDSFCLARRRVVANIFESDDVISGSVIRGVLATWFNEAMGRPPSSIIDENVPQWKTLGKCFNLIRYTTAFPVSRERSPARRPVVPPLSLVRDRKGQCWDAALCDGPFLFTDREEGVTRYRAPSFAIDWKSDEDVHAAFGWRDDRDAVRPRRELRVRTAIDPITRRAKDEQLFAYEMVIPDGFRWHSTIDLERVDEELRPALIAELESLLAIGLAAPEFGIAAFGKTKARGRISISPSVTASEHEPSLAPLDKNLWVVTLQSPALLCDPAVLDETSGQRELHQAYREVFDELSSNKLDLVRYFARQSLAGGEYLRIRFGGKRPYNPFLLTNAGSVFVFRDRGSSGKLIQSWLEHGLPLPAWAIQRYDDSWLSNPYLPDDGFGEITVNLDWHTKKRPEPEAILAVADELEAAR